MIFLQLFYEFFKIGLFAVGGGLATLPFLGHLSDATGWFTRQQLIDMIAISEATPGPIGINMATFVGYITAGVPGAVVATLGVIVPSLIIVLIVARFLEAFADNRTVKSVFYGIRPASLAMITASGYDVLRNTLLNIEKFSASGKALDLFQWKNLALGVIIFYVLQNKKWKVHPVLMIAASAVIGLVFQLGGA